MTRYGKTCASCKTYFVTDSPVDSLCFWCLRMQEGHGQSALLVSEYFQT